ncbi:hypothetical protein ACROYT_G015809 [Oculina patagonica]
MKSTSHPDIEEVETASSKLEVEGDVQEIELKDDNVSGSLGEDESKWTHFPSKKEDQVIEEVELKKKDQSAVKMDPPVCEITTPELSEAHKESFDREEAVEYSTKQSSAVPILLDTQRPEKVSEIFVISPSKDPYEDIAKTGPPCKESLLPLSETVEATPSDPAECLSFHHPDGDNNGLITAPEATKTSQENLFVTENVCFVTLDGE